ncbi:hypothetical protein D030_2498B, partial [Vibrio parahaemolyticus AQ3810]
LLNQRSGRATAVYHDSIMVANQ